MSIADEVGESLTAETYLRLRTEIIQGKIRPNQRLVAAELAERLKVSRTPVREALQLLDAYGMVRSGRRGYVVREHTPDEIREIYEVRAGLEGIAAFLAADRASDEALAQLEAVGAHHDELVKGSRSHLVDLNDRFHDGLMVVAGNRTMHRINDLNSTHFFNYRIAEMYSDEQCLSSVQGHQRIITALLDRDPTAAEAAARQHIFEGLEVMLSKIR